jgi:type IV secretory pathway VirB6-like protein
MNDLSNRYEDERYIYVNNDTMLTDHAIIQGYLNTTPVDELLTYTTSIDTIFAQRLINTSVTTYEVNADGEVQGGKTQEHTVLAASEIDVYDSRGISCASAIMFSDLTISNTSADTWFEVYDNALLWENMISWLLFTIPEIPPDGEVPKIGIWAASIIAIFFVIMVFGSVLFTIGREVRKVEVSETIIKMREQEKLRKKVDKEIEEAYYAEDDVEDEPEEEDEEEKEIDMKSISDEIKKKPPKTRSRSERRRRN